MLSIITLALEFVIKVMIKDIVMSASLSEIVDISFILCFSLVFMADISHSKKMSPFQMPLFLGYILRIFLLFFDIYGQHIYHLPNSGADSSMFYRTSTELATLGYTNRNEFFITFMSTIFKLIGTSRLYGQFLIVLFSVVSLILFVLLISEMDIEFKTKYSILTIVTLLPNLAIISSVFLRESIVAMFITLSFYEFNKWFHSGSFFQIVISFVYAFISAAFHSGAVAVIIGYIAIILLYDRQNHSFRFTLSNLFPAIILLSVFAFLYVNYGDVLFSKIQNVNSLTDIANTSESGGSSYARYVGNSNNPISMVIFTVPRLLYFLFSPFPWQWRGLSDIIAFCFSSLFFMYVVWCDIKFLRSGEQKNRTLVIALTIVAACTAFVFAWGVSNTGTAVRHRDKMTMIWGLILVLTYVPKNYENKSLDLSNIDK